MTTTLTMFTMSVEQLQQKKLELQRRLEIFVHNEIANFQEDNCVSISGVNLDFTTVHKLIEVHPRLVLSSVNIEIKI